MVEIHNVSRVLHPAVSARLALLLGNIFLYPLSLFLVSIHVLLLVSLVVLSPAISQSLLVGGNPFFAAQAHNPLFARLWRPGCCQLHHPNIWCRHKESNPGHPYYKTGALPAEL